MNDSSEQKHRRTLIRILRAVADHGMTPMNRLALIEYLAEDSLGILMQAKCKVCFQTIDSGEYCDAHRPDWEA